MSGSDIIQAVQEGRPQQGWAIFRLRPLIVAANLVGWLVIDALFAAGAVILIYNYLGHSTDKMVLYTGSFLAIMAVLFFIPVFNRLRILLHARDSMVVVAHDCVVRQYCGRLETIPIDAITNLKIVWETGYGFPQHYIELTDRRNNHVIELARNRTFSRAETIYTTLQGRLYGSTGVHRSTSGLRVGSLPSQ